MNITSIKSQLRDKIWSKVSSEVEKQKTSTVMWQIRDGIWEPVRNKNDCLTQLWHQFITESYDA